MMLPVFLLAASLGLAPPAAGAATPPVAAMPRHLFSPALHVHPGPPGSPHVALTLDACTGHVDDRILKALIDNRIAATVFVTGRWLKRNPDALQKMIAHPDLFQIENHGARHLAAIDRPLVIFTVRAAGSTQALQQEILDGAAAVKQATGREPRWYRGAAAEYSAGAINTIRMLNFRLAGFSLSGDGGAGYSARRAAAAIAGAQNGDVIVAHLNQPTKPAGAGVVEGLLALKAKGFVFVRLDERHIAH